MTTWQVTHVAKTQSTMDDAKQAARGGASDRWAIVAQEQAAGRGTHGRAWAGPRGGLYVSFVLRDLHDAHLLTLALGNAVADCLEVAGVEPRLKWVNDVLVGGKKVAGILVESESTGNRFDFLVCGIGINVNGPVSVLPLELQAQATTLEAELQCESCVPDLETLLFQSIDKWLQAVAQDKRQVIDAFRRRDALKGRNVKVETGRGAAAATVSGTSEGIDDEGHLLVRTAKGLERISAGTIHLA